jgi:Icc-related predicted phosphoesterase
MSDTHSQTLDVLEECDILIHCGDFSNLGKLDEVSFFDREIGRLKSIGRIKKAIVVPGNHDLSFDMIKNQFNLNIAPNLQNVDHLLIHDYLEVDGLTIFGTPFVPTFYDWAFMRDEVDLFPIYSQIPPDLDILICHGPPRGILDTNERGESCGSAAMASLIEDLAPKYMAFGHIHPSRGIVKRNWQSNLSTTFINCACVDSKYRPLPAIVLDI